MGDYKTEKNILICKISIVLIFIFISGCTESLSKEEQRFVGTWKIEGTNTTVIFRSDGALSDSFGDSFEVKNGKLTILTRFAGGDEEEIYDYIFSDNDTALLLINLDTEIETNLLKQ